MVRLIKWAVVVAVVEGLILGVLAWLLSGFSAKNFASLALGGLVLVLLITAAWPLISAFSVRFPPLLFPVLSFLATGALTLLGIQIVDKISPGALTIDGFWTAIIVVLGVTFGNTLVYALFSLDDDRSYDWFVTRPLSKTYRDTPRSSVPGFLFLEIDGLAAPILQQAVDLGFMPTLKRWLDSGSHRLRSWEPDLSSQTSASQAGILLGNNTAIPAFRWWDKPSGKLMVSSKMATAQELESRLSSGDGLLVDGGGSRWNVFSGDASDNLGTFSRIGLSSGNGQRSYFAYFANPFTLARTVGLFVAEVARERHQARYQRVHDIQPRIDRTLKYALVRAGTTVLLQETSVFMLTADMFRGMPSVYNTFFAYDEVAHHSGIDRPDSYKVLRRLDHAFAHLERVAASAPRPYYLVILSDHGQSQGATFKQRFGMTLGELVETLISQHVHVGHSATMDEGLSSVSAALTEAVKNDSRTARLVRRAVERQIHDGTVELESEDVNGTEGDKSGPTTDDVVVLASGNLGLISFTKFPTRLTYEQLAESFPGLIAGLAGHEGVSFVLVHSESDGGIVVGKDGINYLDHGYAVGVDPLAPFGPNAAAHLRRTDGFPDAPDLLVMSLYDPETAEVAAFEELVGCHGGLGGTQTEPFLMYPAALELDDGVQIVGAGSLHRVLKSWLTQTQRNPVETDTLVVKEGSEPPLAPVYGTLPSVGSTSIPHQNERDRSSPEPLA